MKQTWWNYGAALAVVKCDKPQADLAEQFQVHPSQITE
jgi:transcriptional regulator CtsR